jgi:hypothetical protein
MRWRERSSRIGIEQRRSLVQRERERERERERDDDSRHDSHEEERRASRSL